MKSKWLKLGLLASCACSLHAGETRSPAWVKVADRAAWAPRDSCGEVVYQDRMWLLGGWFSSHRDGPRDVWSSSDGVNWTLVTQTAAWEHADLPTALVHDGKMWMMGGWAKGRLPGASASNQVWWSTDGAQWHCATRSAGWSARLGAAGVVFNGKMWILGGVERYFDGEPRHLRNDVWHSTDGKQWTLATANAPWAPRAYHAALAFGGKMWVFGGGNYLPTYAGYNDVWNSSDGVHWTKVTEHAPWSPRIWFSSVVHRNRMWLLGGWSNKPSKNWNDVWHTADGVKWEELKTDTIWSKRHEQSHYVFKDSVWIVAGNPWPLTNDVWHLELPAGWERAAVERP
jgi:hypothetical protein